LAEGVRTEESRILFPENLSKEIKRKPKKKHGNRR